MCTKSAPYLFYKRANQALHMELFLCFGAKFVPIEPLESAESAYFFLNFDAKLAPNLT